MVYMRYGGLFSRNIHSVALTGLRATDALAKQTSAEYGKIVTPQENATACDTRPECVFCG